MYDKLGKAAVGFAFRYLRRRYKRELRIGIGVTAVVGRHRRLPGQPQRPRGLAPARTTPIPRCGWGI